MMTIFQMKFSLVLWVFLGLFSLCLPSAQAAELASSQQQMQWININPRAAGAKAAPAVSLPSSVAKPEPTSMTQRQQPSVQVDPIPVSMAPPVPVDAGLVNSDLRLQKWAVLMSDKTLYRTLRRWSELSQYQLMWQVDRDYPIEAEVVFNSTLREAVNQVMTGISLTDYPLQAIFNPSTRVLRVVRHLAEERR